MSGQNKDRREGWVQGSVSSVGPIWKHLAKELLDQDRKLWRLEKNNRREQSEQQNVKNFWMWKWPYCKEQGQKRLYSLDFFFFLGKHGLKFRGTVSFCFCAFSKYLWHFAAEQLLVCWGANAHCTYISSKKGLCNGYLMSTFSLEFSMFIGCFFINWKSRAAILSVLML